MILFVNEKNLYKVIMRSDKPQAEPFQDWGCGDVLPSIRKTGSYAVKNMSRKELALMIIQQEEEMEVPIGKYDGHLQGHDPMPAHRRRGVAPSKCRHHLHEAIRGCWRHNLVEVEQPSTMTTRRQPGAQNEPRHSASC